MTSLKLSPVYCSHCNSFAVAEMAGAPRCWNCIYSEVCISGKKDIDIVPLEIASEAFSTTENLSQSA
ncbi:MAG: hypothetical protein JXX29_04575 [Deltaproteobacteria bacterium]|nr:hypothetical protein [Deltaproteobacteria bacterium]MBN2670920.1 hypothetical protein [Deltaproteobacteria bacterium]